MEARFVGRGAELAELVAALDAALAGRPGVALLTGEPGIGKTRLAAELAGLAGVRAVPVLWGTCTDEDGAPPYWPWRVVFRAWLGRAGREVAAAALTGQAAEVARIAPELPAAPGPAPDGPEQRFALFDAVAGLLDAIAAPAGLVVVLDDVQWADPASSALRAHVARQARSARLLLVVTGRAAGLAGSDLAAELARAPGAVVCELAGLAEPDIAAALADRLGSAPDPDVVTTVAGRTGGNPFFVGEMARLLAADRAASGVPAAVRDVVRRRIARLPDTCRALLGPAAVLGREIDVARLAAFTGAPVLDGLRPAIADGLLDRHPRFAHDLVRETVLADLDAGERARVHLAVVGLLEPASADPDVVGELAHHALAALPDGDVAAALGWARKAGQVALSRSAFEDAARLLRRAADLTPGVLDPRERVAVLLEAAQAQARAHDVAGATATCGEAADLARATGDAAALGRAALVQESVTDLPWLAAARDWCDEALHGLGDADSPLRARLLAHLAATRLVLGEAGPEVSGEALAMAERLDDPAALRAALRARQLARAGAEGNRERLDLGGRMLALGRRTGEADTAMWGHLWRFDALLQAGRTDDAEAELGPLDAAVARSRQPLARLHLLRSRFAIAATRGRFAEAAHLNDEAIAIARRGRHEAALMNARGAACSLAVLTGSDDLEDLPELDRVIPMRHPYAQLIQLSMAMWHLALGRREQASTWCGNLLPPDTPRVPAFMLLVTAAARAQVAAAFGEADVAATVHRLLAPHADLHVVGGAGAMESRGSVRLYLGMAALTAGRAGAVEHLRGAVGACDAAGAVAYAAISRLWLARALRARGRPGDGAEAAAAVVAASATAAELGMAPLARDLAALDAGGGNGLSRREREIADLVGRGLTNRQIAAAAHISERTVETHVQHVLAKLGFARRSEIAAWVARGSH